MKALRIRPERAGRWPLSLLPLLLLAAAGPAAAHGLGGKDAAFADVNELREFILDRLRGYYSDQSIPPQQFDAVGILALQLHSGPPTVAQFKDVRLKVLTPAEPRR